MLAGGYPQISLINSLKRRGITTILADYYSEPVAKKYADAFYQISTLDVDAIRQLAVRENVGLIITVCTDQALLTMARVSEDLGLPCYLDYNTALNVTNKQHMKKVFAENGIPTAEFAIAESPADIRLNFPLVVKPADCNSSKGVVKVSSSPELEDAFTSAKKLSRTGSVIVERYTAGVEVSVDAWVENGQAKILCMSRNDKIPGTFVIFRGFYPCPEAMKIGAKIQETVQKIADAFGLKNCPMLIQLITDGENVHVLEFSARTGGGTKHIMINHVAGLDVVDMTVELALGNFPEVPAVSMADTYLADEFIYCSEGVFERLEGFDALKEKGTLTDYYLFKWDGAEFDGGVHNSGDRIAGFTIKADTLEELTLKHDEAVKHLSVIGQDGRDIMRHDLLGGIL
ncbi:MAG: ATP-grasp domain-containing protein [Synergistaceae bacterium]|nr:ATP-grasp domain-containing protein [Synergistaceae bacterium]